MTLPTRDETEYGSNLAWVAQYQVHGYPGRVCKVTLKRNGEVFAMGRTGASQCWKAINRL